MIAILTWTDEIIAVCKDSYVVYACGFDRNGKWEWFCESKLRCKNDVVKVVVNVSQVRAMKNIASLDIGSVQGLEIML